MNAVYRTIRPLIPSGPRHRLGVLASRLGWEIRPNDLRARFVRTVIPKNGVGAELGVHKGYFTDLLLSQARPKKLHLVDPWYLQGLEWEWGRQDRNTVHALCRLMKRLQYRLADGSVVLHIGGDLEILPTFEDAYFDWLYIDTIHQYDHASKELALAERVVKPEGIICGDDWYDDPNHRFAGVRQAVEEFCANSAFRIIYANAQDRQWAISRH